ncbi:MAG: hypothetical protein ACRD2I_08140 [Vicinamibacterales bacterium]
MKLNLMLAAWLVGIAAPALAQLAEPIAVVLDVRSEGRPTRDAVATRLLGQVQSGLEAISDVEVVPPEHARRTIWIVTGATPTPLAASVIVTERYDRETLMVLGIEDDDMAERMMALQIVVDHQIFTGRDSAALAQRIVAAVNDGIFAKLRTLKAKPKP